MKKTQFIKIIYRLIGVILVFVIGSIIYGVTVESIGHGFIPGLIIFGMVILTMKVSGFWDWMKKRKKLKKK